MPNIRMRPTDLGELYALLSMYRNTYGNIPEGLTEQVARHYQEAAAFSQCMEGESSVPPVTNPRGAGRKGHTDPDEAAEIIKMRHSGMTIRKIAQESGCSVGRVHKLIHEHTGKDTAR